MALLFSSGFDKTTDVSKETHAGDGRSIVAAAGRNGSNALKLTPNTLFGTRGWARWNLGVTANTVIVSVWLNLSGSGNPFFELLDNGTIQWKMTLDSDGTVHVTGSSTTFFLSPGSHHFKAKVTIGNSGAHEVHVDGIQVLQESGVDTQATANAYATQFVLGDGGQQSMTITADDLVIMDDTGSEFNDIMPDLHIEYLHPTAAGDETDFTPSTGSNYTCVDETDSNGTTDNVTSATIGDRDLYTMSDLASTTGEIHAVKVVMLASKSDAGMRLVKGCVKHGGVVGEGSESGLTTSTVYYQSVFTTNPSTGSAWTIAEVNAMQAGMEITG